MTFAPLLRSWKLLAGGVLVFALSGPSEAASTASDAELQKLGNHRALRALAAKEEGRSFLASVSRAYRTAGYGQLARALGQSGAYLDLLRDRDVKAVEIRRARQALRRVRRALGEEATVALDVAAGVRRADFLGLADAFSAQGARVAAHAAANLRAPRPFPAVLRFKPVTAWLTGTATGAVTSSDSFGAIMTSVGWGVDLFATTDERWIAILPGAEVTFDPLVEILREVVSEFETRFGQQTFPTGTRFLKLAVSAPVPAGAVAFEPGPRSLERTWNSAGNLTVIGGGLGFSGTVMVLGGSWAMIPPGAAIPGDALSSRTYVEAVVAGGTEFPAGSILVSLAATADPLLLPEGSVVLIPPFTVGPVPAE